MAVTPAIIVHDTAPYDAPIWLEDGKQSLVVAEIAAITCQPLATLAAIQ